jgi:L-alanine-DL-glutamate epimerase-like enolase superfamily enzyme
MRIVEIRERDAAMGSAIRNAYIDFSTMTCSTVAVVTDQVRDGKSVIGYGFTSNGRYGAGALLRDRFIPRLMAARADDLLDESGLVSPQKCWAKMMTNEKPGGHGERSTAVGAVDMATWDAVAKVAGVPLYQLLADRYRGGEVDRQIWVYAAGGC